MLMTNLLTYRSVNKLKPKATMSMFRLTSFIVSICLVPPVFAQNQLATESVGLCGVVLDVQSRPTKGDPDNFYISLRQTIRQASGTCGQIGIGEQQDSCYFSRDTGYYRTTGPTGTRNPSFQSAKYAPVITGYYQDISLTNHAIPKVGDRCYVMGKMGIEGGWDLSGVAQSRSWNGIVSLTCFPPHGIQLCM